MKLANPPGAQFEILVDGKPFRARRNGGRPWQRQSASVQVYERDSEQHQSHPPSLPLAADHRNLDSSCFAQAHALTAAFSFRASQ